MALDTAAQWKDGSEGWTVDRLRDEQSPASLTECMQNQAWYEILHRYATANLANENLDFLAAVKAFKASNDLSVAAKVYRDYVASNVVNLYSANREALDQLFQDDDQLGSLDMFDGAYGEVSDVIEADLYSKFKLMASRVQRELTDEAHEEENTAAEEIEIGSPTLVALTRDRIDDAVVDNFNQVALKELDEGTSTNYWQLGDLVIIGGGSDTLGRPYVEWIRSQDGVERGTITMTSKGGAFGAGSVSVAGGGSHAAIEAAIGRVSKKKVKFA